MKITYFDSVLFEHSYFTLLFGIDCLFIVLFTFEIYIMDTKMLEAINYIRNVIKKKVTIDRIITYLNNAGESNWDKDSAEANLK